VFEIYPLVPAARLRSVELRRGSSPPKRLSAKAESGDPVWIKTGFPLARE